MSFPLYIFLIVYIVVVVILLIFAVATIYHVTRYALKTRVSITITSFFISGLVVILGVSGFFISQIEWSERIMFMLTP